LNVKGMAKTKLSKSILDAAPGEFFRQVEYKASWNNRHAVSVDRWFPSSKLCSICGYKNVNLQLSDRQWLCPDCGTQHHRDINAAMNLRDEGFRLLVAAGHAETLNACGVNVRPGFRAVNPEAGISIL
jgi:putative transposase